MSINKWAYSACAGFTKEPEMTNIKALELAEELEQMFEETPPECEEAAQELRRLHQLNQDMLEALKDLLQEAQDMRKALAASHLATSYSQLEAFSAAEWAIAESEK